MKLSSFAKAAAAFVALTVLDSCAATHEAAAPQATIAPLPAVPARVVPIPAEKPTARPADAWSTNEEALKIIEDAEGLRLRAYRLAGQWLIGYGHATDEPEETVRDLTITAGEAKALLRADIRDCEGAVRDVVNVPVTQNQFSALVAFCYNAGPGALAKSRMVRHLNNGDREDAAEAFLLYDHARMEDEKVRVASLTKRRINERYLFLAS